MAQIKQNAYPNANHSTNSHNLGANLGASKASSRRIPEHFIVKKAYVNLFDNYEMGAILTKAVYWTENVFKKQPQKEGWFYKSIPQFASETGMSYAKARKAIERLIQLPFVATWKGKGSRDNVRWFFIDLAGLEVALRGEIPTQTNAICPKSITSFSQSETQTGAFSTQGGLFFTQTLRALNNSLNKNTTKTSGTQKDDASCVASNVENVVVDFNLISEKEKALTERFSIDAPSVEILPTVQDVTPCTKNVQDCTESVQHHDQANTNPTIKDRSETVVDSHKQPFTPFSAEIKENVRSTEEIRLERLKMAKNETVSEMLARLEKKSEAGNVPNEKETASPQTEAVPTHAKEGRDRNAHTETHTPKAEIKHRVEKPQTQTNTHPLVKQLQAFGIAFALASELLSTHGEKRVYEVIQASSTAKNKAGWIRNALNFGWVVGATMGATSQSGRLFSHAEMIDHCTKHNLLTNGKTCLDYFEKVPIAGQPKPSWKLKGATIGEVHSPPQGHTTTENTAFTSPTTHEQPKGLRLAYSRNDTLKTQI